MALLEALAQDADPGDTVSCEHCPHCHPPVFRHGVRVRFKEHKPGRTSRVGIIRGRPRAGSVTAYVVWPDGWAGHAFLDELEVVP